MGQPWARAGPVGYGQCLCSLPWGAEVPAAPLLGAVPAMSALAQGPASGLCLSSGLGASLRAAAGLPSVQRGWWVLQVVWSDRLGARGGVGMQKGLGSCCSPCIPDQWNHSSQCEQDGWTLESGPAGVALPVGTGLGAGKSNLTRKTADTSVCGDSPWYTRPHAFYFENCSTATVRGWGWG